ncbi:MAG TPA: hypothetical protein VGH96_04910 [Streptosporangiaceae bacterium]
MASSRPAAWARAHWAAIVPAWYLLCALFVTSHLWFNPAARRQIGDVQDVNQATWFMRYAATAIEHFRLPALTTTAMNAPHGVNLMWNTSLLLPGSLMTPVTLYFGPQVSLTVLLVVGFAGSAAAMFYVLRRWQSSVLAAALGGMLYGFSPALVNSGIGHYSLVLAFIPPLLIDRLLRIVTGQGSAVRNGIWLGLLAAAQLFIAEETLVDTVIAALILLAVLAISRPKVIGQRIRPTLTGLAAGAGVALVICARALWVQFHGIAAGSAAATVLINYRHRLTNLGSLPYSFVTPSNTVLFHTSASVASAGHYPQPVPEYLAYLGVPLIILLVVAVIYFWRNLTIRTAGITCLVLEWLGLGAKQLVPHADSLPGFLMPWQYLQHLPVLSGMVPDRLCILADAAAAVVLAFSLDLARREGRPFGRSQLGGMIAAGIAVLAILPVVPAPYYYLGTGGPPSGWRATFAALHVAPADRVLIAPFPWEGTSQVMRWQAVTGEPATMIGGDFIAPGQPGHKGRAGRAGLTATTVYIDALFAGQAGAAVPSAAQIHADLAAMKPAIVVADTAPGTPLGHFLIQLFGQPTTQINSVLGWRLAR